MLDEMALRAFSDKTLSLFIGRSPDTATTDDLCAFQARQRLDGVQQPTMNSTVSALQFFFTFVCDQLDLVKYLPIVPTQQEAAQLTEAAPGPKYRAVFGVANGAGLRVSEVANLKISDIDSERMILRVEQGANIRVILVLLEHATLDTTARYAHVPS